MQYVMYIYKRKGKKNNNERLLKKNVLLQPKE
jgi:hypothetical protein